jgi:hypothetical protein
MSDSTHHSHDHFLRIVRPIPPTADELEALVFQIREAQAYRARRQQKAAYPSSPDADTRHPFSRPSLPHP